MLPQTPPAGISPSGSFAFPDPASSPISNETKPHWNPIYRSAKDAATAAAEARRLGEPLDVGQVGADPVEPDYGTRTLIAVPALAVDTDPSAAIIDTLTITFPEFDLREVLNERSKNKIYPYDLRGTITDDDIIDGLTFELELAGLPFEFEQEDRPGKNFYRWSRRVIYRDDIESRNLGFLAWGGNGDTWCLHLTGEACESITPAMREGMHWLLVQLCAKITNIHLAHDDFQGHHPVNWACEQYDSGGFSNGGRPPSLSCAGNWRFADGRGRTLYIGRREHGKMVRIYEKGQQLGDPNSPWVRWELELRSTGRRIPLDVLLRPGCYLAGAAPVLARVVQRPAELIRTVRTKAKILYEAALENIRRSYGQYLHVVVEVSGLDAVLDLCRPGVPKRLLQPIGSAVGAMT